MAFPGGRCARIGRYRELFAVGARDGSADGEQVNGDGSVRRAGASGRSQTRPRHAGPRGAPPGRSSRGASAGDGCAHWFARRSAASGAGDSTGTALFAVHPGDRDRRLEYSRTRRLGRYRAFTARGSRSIPVALGVRGDGVSARGTGRDRRWAADDSVARDSDDAGRDRVVAGTVVGGGSAAGVVRSEEHTSELPSLAYLVCRL